MGTARTWRIGLLLRRQLSGDSKRRKIIIFASSSKHDFSNKVVLQDQQLRQNPLCSNWFITRRCTLVTTRWDWIRCTTDLTLGFLLNHLLNIILILSVKREDEGRWQCLNGEEFGVRWLSVRKFAINYCFSWFTFLQCILTQLQVFERGSNQSILASERRNNLRWITFALNQSAHFISQHSTNIMISPRHQRSTVGLVLVSIILVLLLSFLLANVIYSHQVANIKNNNWFKQNI